MSTKKTKDQSYETVIKQLNENSEIHHIESFDS